MCFRVAFNIYLAICGMNSTVSQSSSNDDESPKIKKKLSDATSNAIQKRINMSL